MQRFYKILKPISPSLKFLHYSKMGASQSALLNQKAPDFELKDQSGTSVRLSEFRDKKNVVMFFYPKDGTAGCTRQACSFRDNLGQLNSLDAVVLGISADSVDSHKEFAKSHNLNFSLLSDPDKQLRKLFGVPTSLGVVDGRVTYVIDKSGVVQHAFNSQVSVYEHVKQAKTVLEKLNSQ